MNKKRKAVFMIAVLLFHSVFVNLKCDLRFGIMHSPFLPKYIQTLASQDQERDNECMWAGTCKANFKEEGVLPVCYCDQKCKDHNDCCFDANLNDTPATNYDFNYIKKFKSCEDRLFHNKNFGILMVTKCPLSYDNLISEKCAQLKHPVSADDGTIYKNVYCAYCHNESQYIAWQFEYNYGNDNCSEKNIEQFNTSIPVKMKYILENKCNYYFLPPENRTYRTCFKDVETTDTLCSEFQNPVMIANKLYRNVYCFNDSTNIDISYCLRNLAAFSGYFKGYDDLILTRIFNIRPVLEIYGQRMDCEDQFYYDTTKEACIPNNCREKSTSACDSELIRYFQWKKNLKLYSDNILDLDFICRLSKFILLSLPFKYYGITIGRIRANYQCGTSQNYQEKHCCVGDIMLDFKNHAAMIPGTTSKFLSDARKMMWMYQERITEKRITAYDSSENATLNCTCNTTGSSTFSVAQFGKILSLSMCDFANQNKTKISNEIPKRVKGVAVLVNESNPKFTLEIWELEYTANNTNETRFTNPNTEGLDLFTVGTILTYLTLGISCSSLLVTLIVYSSLRLFRSLPGVISKHMIGNMLVAQLLFIGGAGASDITVVCTVVGIISHFLWLCSFTWISAFLFSILRMMALLRSYPGALSQKRRVSIVYYCFGYLLPLMIVLLCSLLDIFTDIDIGYSNGSICFPTGFPANLFSFTIPVLLSLFVNVVVLILTSKSIAKYNNTTQLLTSVRKMRSFIPIYIRLNILCACPWILGIIADIVESEILRYVYILLAGSHGTFVGFSFLLARSVRSRIRSSSKTKTNDLELSDRR